MINLSLYIIPIILFFLFISLIIPIYATINLDIFYNEVNKMFEEYIDLDDKKYKLNNKNKYKNKLYIKLFNLFLVYSYDIKKNILAENEEKVFDKVFSLYEKINNEKIFSNSNYKAEKKKRLVKNLIKDYFKNVYIDKFILIFGVDTKDPIYNSYINALLNASLCMYINTKQSKFNFNKLYYSIYTSKEPIRLKTIFTLRTSIIIVLIESLKRIKKEGKIKIKIKKASIL